MQFRLPQFIDVEDKILGPLTWKQFAYCLGAAGIAYIGIRITGSRTIGLLVTSPIIGIFLSLAFLKINNQSFVDVAKNGINYFLKSNLYTWRKPASSDLPTSKLATKDTVLPTDNVPTYERRNLKILASSLDTKEVENDEEESV